MRHLKDSLIELSHSNLFIPEWKVYLYSTVLLIAPEMQFDTKEWGDKQILWLLIVWDRNGVQPVDRWSRREQCY